MNFPLPGISPASPPEWVQFVLTSVLPQKLKRSMFSLLKMNGAPSLISSSTTSILPSLPAAISLSPRLSVPVLSAFET